MDGSGSLARLPEEIEREIAAFAFGVECLLPEALDRRREYASCLAELDLIRHNVQTGDKITQRTLREWAERPVAKKHEVLMWRLEQCTASVRVHLPEITRPSAPSRPSPYWSPSSYYIVYAKNLQPPGPLRRVEGLLRLQPQ